VLARAQPQIARNTVEHSRRVVGQCGIGCDATRAPVRIQNFRYLEHLALGMKKARPRTGTSLCRKKPAAASD